MNENAMVTLAQFDLKMSRDRELSLLENQGMSFDPKELEEIHSHILYGSIHQHGQCIGRKDHQVEWIQGYLPSIRPQLMHLHLDSKEIKLNLIEISFVLILRWMDRPSLHSSTILPEVQYRRELYQLLVLVIDEPNTLSLLQFR